VSCAESNRGREKEREREREREREGPSAVPNSVSFAVRAEGFRNAAPLYRCLCIPPFRPADGQRSRNREQTERERERETEACWSARCFCEHRRKRDLPLMFGIGTRRSVNLMLAGRALSFTAGPGANCNIGSPPDLPSSLAHARARVCTLGVYTNSARFVAFED